MSLTQCTSQAMRMEERMSVTLSTPRMIQRQMYQDITVY